MRISIFRKKGSRADLQAIMAQAGHHAHSYSCGPDNFMMAVADAARAAGFFRMIIFIKNISQSLNCQIMKIMISI